MRNFTVKTDGTLKPEIRIYEKNSPSSVPEKEGYYLVSRKQPCTDRDEIYDVLYFRKDEGWVDPFDDWERVYNVTGFGDRLI